MATIARDDITGLVLAGGRGLRLGGVDKGLQPAFDDAAGAVKPLALLALDRLAPQVGPRLVSANRHPDVYRAFGVPVVADADDARDGPLAGVLAALGVCRTPWLAHVPCDAPRFPRDLVARLAAAVEADGAGMAIAVTRGAADAGDIVPPRPQPVFGLLHVRLRPALAAFLRAGGRSAGHWAASRGAARVAFDDDGAFFNANTPAELAQMGPHGHCR